MSTSNSFEVVTKKLSIPHKFACFWKNGKSCTDLLVLDFNPIIETFDLSGHYCLVHFQARPKPLRTWGIYYSGTQEYESVDFIDIQVRSSTLRLDENIHRTVPTSVIYCPCNQVLVVGNEASIRNH